MGWLNMKSLIGSFQPETISLSIGVNIDPRCECAKFDSPACWLVPVVYRGARATRSVHKEADAASAQFRAFEPVEHEQRACEWPQLLGCKVALVLAAVGRKFSQTDGRRHDADLQQRAPYRCGRWGCCGSAGKRPLLVVAVASRLDVVVDAPPTLPTEPSAGFEPWIGSIKLYRLWPKRRSSCLSPSLGTHGLQDGPPRSGQPNTTS